MTIYDQQTSTQNLFPSPEKGTVALIISQHWLKEAMRSLLGTISQVRRVINIPNLECLSRVIGDIKPDLLIISFDYSDVDFDQLNNTWKEIIPMTRILAIVDDVHHKKMLMRSGIHAIVTIGDPAAEIFAKVTTLLNIQDGDS